MTIARKIALNTIVQGAGKVVMLLLSLLILGSITRYLGPEKYGIYSLIFVYLSFFSVISDIGLYTVTLREISKDISKAEEIINNSIVLRIILSIMFIIIAIIFSFIIYGSDENSAIRYGIALVSVTVLFNLINTTTNAVFQANIRMEFAVLSELLGRIAALSLIILVIILKGNIYYMILATAAGSLVNSVFNIFFIRRFLRLRPTLNLQYGLELFKKALPLAAALIINVVYFRADMIIISLFRDSSEMGIYGLSYKMLETSLLFPAFFIASIFPVIANYITNLPEKVESFVQKSFDLLLMVGIPIMAGGIITARYLVNVIAGEQFSDAVLAFQILVLAAPLIFINGFFGNMIIAKSKEREALWLNISALTFNLVLNFIFIPIYGYIAAALITLLSEIIIMAGAIYLIKKMYNFLPRLNIMPKIGAASLIMAGLLFLLMYTGIFNENTAIFETLLLITGGASVYIIFLFVFRAVNKKTILDVLGR